MNFIRKPFLVRQRGLKVFAMASRFMGLFVRNLAMMENVFVAWSDFRDRPFPSFSDSERDFQRLDKSSIAELEG